jgi:hypothetical protein
MDEDSEGLCHMGRGQYTAAIRKEVEDEDVVEER